jgi:hypothetical protein
MTEPSRSNFGPPRSKDRNHLAAKESPQGMTEPYPHTMAIALGLACLAACAGEPSGASQSAAAVVPPGAVTKVTEHGPVKVTVQVWPHEPRLGDPIHLRLTAESQAGVSIDLPYQETALGRFRVSTYDRSEHREGATRIQVQDYELDAPSSGRHRIPPFRLELIDPNAAGSGTAPGKPVEILTEEIPLQIAEVDVAQTTATLPPPRGTLDPEVGGRPWWTWVVAGLIAAWLVLGVLLVRRMRRQRAVRIKITAYDAAIARLHALEQRGAPSGDDADAWFVELSGIARRYLEARYDIRAPEQTTEEFLQEAGRAAELTPAHRDLLSAFMARCDRVKFANHRPDAEESLATLRAARGFVEDTRLRPQAAAEAA